MANAQSKFQLQLTKAVVYTCTTSKMNMNGGSQVRQLQAIQGMVSMDAEVKTIFVESASRVARSVQVVEEICQRATASGTQIIDDIA